MGRQDGIDNRREVEELLANLPLYQGRAADSVLMLKVAYWFG